MKRENIKKLIDDALAIEAESAMKADTVGFMCRALTIATMPHKKPTGPFYVRRNGGFTLTMSQTRDDIGLPYGTKPRLLMSWLATEAVRTRERTLVLGNSLSGFMREIGLTASTGKRGQATGFRDQTRKLFSCAISAHYENKVGSTSRRYTLTDADNLWWDTKRPDQINLWTSSVTLSERFYNELIAHPVPLDLRALRALSRSPMALDIYIWLTYRLSYLYKPTLVRWEALHAQFGADYTRVRDFKRKFITQLTKVLTVYQSAKAYETPLGLRLSPSRSHVPKRRSGR